MSNFHDLCKQRRHAFDDATRWLSTQTFPWQGVKVGWTNIEKRTVVTGDASPVRQPCRCLQVCSITRSWCRSLYPLLTLPSILSMRWGGPFTIDFKFACRRVKVAELDGGKTAFTLHCHMDFMNAGWCALDSVASATFQWFMRKALIALFPELRIIALNDSPILGRGLWVHNALPQLLEDRL